MGIRDAYRPRIMGTGIVSRLHITMGDSPEGHPIRHVTQLAGERLNAEPIARLEDAWVEASRAVRELETSIDIANIDGGWIFAIAQEDRS